MKLRNKHETKSALKNKPWMKNENGNRNGNGNESESESGKSST